MALYRMVHTSFWSDTKIVDEMLPQDKYFMLYLLTNPHTNQIGCYEISIKDMSRELGYEPEEVIDLLKRFEDKLKLINYSPITKEIFIKNWNKYNWTLSPKVKRCIEKELKGIKSVEFIEKTCNLLNEKYGKDSVCIRYGYTMHTKKRKRKRKTKRK